MPRSILVFTPISSISAIVSYGIKAENAEYINLGFVTTFEIKSSKSKQAFVTLHLPLPVIITLRAGREFFSIIVTSKPRFAAVAPAIKPDAPAPITITFFIKMIINYYSASVNLSDSSSHSV